MEEAALLETETLIKFEVIEVCASCCNTNSRVGHSFWLVRLSHLSSCGEGSGRVLMLVFSSSEALCLTMQWTEDQHLSERQPGPYIHCK